MKLDNSGITGYLQMISIEEQRKLMAEIRQEKEIRKWLKICKWLNIGSIIAAGVFFLVAIIAAAAFPLSDYFGKITGAELFFVSLVGYGKLLILFFLVPITIAGIVSWIIRKKTNRIINERLQVVISERMAEKSEASAAKAEADNSFDNHVPTAATSSVATSKPIAADEETELRKKVTVIKKYHMYSIISTGLFCVACLLALIPTVSVLNENLFCVTTDISVIKCLFDSKVDVNEFLYALIAIDAFGGDGPNAYILAFANMGLTIGIPAITILGIIIEMIQYVGVEEKLRNGPKRMMTFNMQNGTRIFSKRAIVIWAVIGILFVTALEGYSHLYYNILLAKAGADLNYFTLLLPVVVYIGAMVVHGMFMAYYAKNVDIINNYSLLSAKKVGFI